MADEQELAALRAQIAALEARVQQRPAGATFAGGFPYAVHTHIHPQCFELCYMPIPSGGEDDDAPLQRQLSRIEAQLERVIALLEK
ncbi:MAG: hypothetical protein ACR2JW_15125 [Thermomicrobiales bacterium]